MLCVLLNKTFPIYRIIKCFENHGYLINMNKKQNEAATILQKDGGKSERKERETETERGKGKRETHKIINR